jgi:hypothetical protein
MLFLMSFQPINDEKEKLCSDTPKSLAVELPG